MNGLTDEEWKRVSYEAYEILEKLGIKPLLDCGKCSGELTMRIETVPAKEGVPAQLVGIAYNCAYCLAMNWMWQAPEV